MSHENDEEVAGMESSNELAAPGEEDSEDTVTRRDFLRGAKGWSAIVAGLALAINVRPEPAEAGWINYRGGGWINRGGWHNGGWINSRAGWINGIGGWINGGGGWINNAGWINGANGWINRGGWVNHAGWINGRYGGGWINRW